jgi:hypothetical protein
VASHFSSSVDEKPLAPASSSQKRLQEAPPQGEAAPPAGVAHPLQSLDPISRAILDSLPAHIAVVNAEGTILLINAAWAQFARDNGDPELHRTGVGANYFAVCQEASGPSAAEAQQVLTGMFSILRGEAEAEACARAAQFAPLEEERREFERLFGAGGTRVTAQTFGLGAVRHNHPEFFRACVQRYETVLDLALEQRVYRVEHPLAEQIRSLSEQLGFLRAGPCDVIDVHRTALRTKTANTPGPKVQAYTQEGRLLVVKLMGDLVLYDRALAMGKRPPTQE